jgi:hypothetical protein
MGDTFLPQGPKSIPLLAIMYSEIALIGVIYWPN